VKRYEALKHAVKAHGKELDKCGELAVLHPIAVSEAVEGADTLNIESHVVVALLHDVLEDTDYVLPSEDLAGDEARALVAITRQTDREPHPETYAAYIERICESNEIAWYVKLADLSHNLSPERQGCLPEGERKGLEKRYLKARDRIWEALGYAWWPSPPAAVPKETSP
jgi:(p)ppGpp synthase/HD superfamily hydrolase